MKNIVESRAEDKVQTIPLPFDSSLREPCGELVGVRMRKKEGWVRKGLTNAFNGCMMPKTRDSGRRNRKWRGRGRGRR